ncbi:MAG: hypothetical protein QM679_09020 [Patulibacter sp.]
MPNQIDGLPTHPLIVHVPLVFGPLAGVAALGLLVPSWRRRLIWPLAGLAAITALFAILAVQSGEWLIAHLAQAPGPGIGDHMRAAQRFRTIELVFAGALILDALTINRVAGRTQHLLIAGVVALGLVSVAAVVQTGHLGAKAAWSQQITTGSRADR